MTLKELQIHKLTITKKQKKQKRAKPSQPRPLQSRIFPPLEVRDEIPQEIRHAHFFNLRQLFQFYAKIGSCADVQIHGLFPIGGFTPRVFAATAAGGFFLGKFFFVHRCLFEAAKIKFFDYVLTFSIKKDENIFDYVLTVSIFFVYLCIVKGLRHSTDTPRQRRKRETHRTTKEAEKDKKKSVPGPRRDPTRIFSGPFIERLKPHRSNKEATARSAARWQGGNREAASIGKTKAPPQGGRQQQRAGARASRPRTISGAAN